MSSDDRDAKARPDAPQDAGSPLKRPTPTIELEAEEVAVSENEAQTTDDDADAPDSGAASADTAEIGGDEMVDGVRPPGPQPEDNTEEPPSPQARAFELRSFATHLAAGLAGGLIGVIGVGVALDRLPSGGQDQTPAERAAMDARLAQLEQSVAALPAQDTGAAALGKVADRVAALEAQANSAETARAAQTATLEDLAKRAEALDGAVSEQAAVLTKARDRFGRLETTLKRIDETASSGGGDLAQFTALAGRITELGNTVEGRIAALEKARAETTPQGDALEAKAAQIGEALAALETRVSEVETAAASATPGTEIAELSERIAKLEEELGQLGERQLKLGGEARSAGLAIAFANLSRAVTGAKAYEAELGAVKRLAPEGFDFSALDAHASTGVATRGTIARDFPNALRAALRADTSPRSDSLVDRLVSNARSIVQVRRTTPDEGEGGAASAVLARMEGRLRAGDLEGAVSEGAALEGGLAKAMQPWLARAKTRVAVDAAMAGLEQALVSALAEAGGAER